MASDRRDYGTGSVSQRKDGTWTARVYLGRGANGKPQIKAIYGKTEREVKRKLKEFQHELHKNDFTVVQRSTVENYIRTWLYENKANSLKPKSFDRLEQTVLYQVIPEVGRMQLSNFKSSDVQQMVNNLKSKGLSYSSVKKAYDVINECFRTGVIQRTVTFNPALGVSVPSQKSFGKKEIRFYNDDEVERLIATAEKKYMNGKRIYRLGDVVALDINTGLRLAELLGLKWSDVSFERKTVTVSETRVVVKDRGNSEKKKYLILSQDSAKTETSIRDVDLNNAAVEALMGLQAVTGNFEYVLSTEDGKPIHPRYLDRLLRKIAVAAGFEEDRVFGFHALRHTFATRLFAAGIDVKTVSELLGHSDVTITYNTYIHVIKKARQDAVSKIG